MNADATPSVAVDVNVGAKAGFVLPLALIMLGFGAVLTALAVVLIIVGARDTGHVEPGGEVATASGHDMANQPESAAGPVSLTARLDPELSRWKWLVKWFLAIPHFIVLAFLWLAFVALTFVALLTRASVRWLATSGDRFGFDLTGGGVLLGILATDTYPPFRLDQGGNEPVATPDPAPTTPGTPPTTVQSPIDEPADATPLPVRARDEVPA